ncbi:phage portal protein [Solibacillus isronensis]|uniref:phage portal protein n=1 Tax=Solibacillus isronensis TaxID=412383 RepID=UPI0039A31142
MGLLEFFKRKDVQFSFDLELFQDVSERAHMRKLAIDTCASFLARTISQAEFRVKENGKYTKNELYRRLNLRPNVNQTASTYWQKTVYKLVYENECLIIKSDTDDLLVADSFVHNSKAVYEDTFSQVTVNGYTFERVFKQSEVLHLKFANEKLSPLIDALYKDYGELFGRILSSQKRKNQIRSTVNIDAMTSKSDEGMANVQDFIDRAYKSFSEKDVAFVPQMPGFEYKEHFSGGGNGILSVDEINKVTDGFFDQVALALGIPIPLIRGDMADVEKVTKNYMMYTIKPLVKKISDEINAKFVEPQDYLNGDIVTVKVPNYLDIFDLSNAVDKLRSSGIMNGNEIRTELGLEEVDIPQLNSYFITKNYSDVMPSEENLKGGENE